MTTTSVLHDEIRELRKEFVEMSQIIGMAQGVFKGIVQDGRLSKHSVDAIGKWQQKADNFYKGKQ